MADLNVNSIGDASGGTTATVNGYTPTVSNMAGRNRIINGDMRVSQRFGATSTGTVSGGAYTLDRWLALVVGGTANLSFQQTTTAPSGFYNSLAVTVGTGVTPAGTDERSLAQRIEGLNVADLAWGTANAKPVTVSFWVRSSVAGTFGFTVSNAGFNRTFVQSYVINSADTWEHKTITISGDTSGTWYKDTGQGIALYWDLGVGTTYSGTASSSWQAAGYEGLTGGTKLSATSGATFYITGVQLEKGSTATSFDYRPYGTELALCQRYYCKTFSMSVVPGNNVASEGAFMLGSISSGNYEPSVTWRYPVEMRAAPSITLYNPGSGTAGQWDAGGGVAGANARALFIGTSSAVIDNTDTTLAGGNGWRIQATASIEL